MTAKQFTEGLSALDDRYIAEASVYQVKRKPNPAVRWLSAAASLALVAALGIAVLQCSALKKAEPSVHPRWIWM